MSNRDGDVWNDPEMKRWSRRVVRELAPMIQGSALTMSLVPEGEGDVKFAVELGFSIMLGKPIILVVAPGRVVPEKLVRVADEIVEGDLGDEDMSRRMSEAIDRVLSDT